MSCRSLGIRQESAEDRGRALPFTSFLFDPSSSRAREAIVLCFPVVVGDAPLGGDVALLLELEERRVERAVIDCDRLTADLLDAAGDAVPVLRPHGLEGFQDHQGERALADIGSIGHGVLGREP
jgi:hypothetical protein